MREWRRREGSQVLVAIKIKMIKGFLLKFCDDVKNVL